jgi:arylsulfatase A-like enzyme
VDTFFRLDRTVARLLGWLDTSVGAGRYTVVLTSDHGAASLPERSGAVRMPPDSEIAATIEKALPAGHKVGFLHPNLFIEPRDPTALQTARKVLLGMRGVERVLGISDLVPAHDPDAEAVLRAWDPERSGDFYVVLAPNCVFEENLTMGQGTGHGSPRMYDREVPVVFYGARVQRGVGRKRVPEEAVAPTVAALLGVPPPPVASENALELSSPHASR